MEDMYAFGTAAVGIICLTIMEYAAIQKGINGKRLATVATVVGTVVGAALGVGLSGT